MNTKLTLSLNNQTIERAKDYARSNNISLSKIIEAYLEKLVRQDMDNEQFTPLVQSLSGIIQLPDDYNYKNEYGEFLIRKYK